MHFRRGTVNLRKFTVHGEEDFSAFVLLVWLSLILATLFAETFGKRLS